MLPPMVEASRRCMEHAKEKDVTATQCMRAHSLNAAPTLTLNTPALNSTQPNPLHLNVNGI